MTLEQMKEKLTELRARRYGVFVSQQELYEMSGESMVNMKYHEERLERRAASLDKRIDVLRNAIAAFA